MSPNSRRLEHTANPHPHPRPKGYGVAVRKTWWRRLLDLFRRSKTGERLEDPAVAGPDERGEARAGARGGLEVLESRVLKLSESLGAVSERLATLGDRMDRLDEELEELQLWVRKQAPASPSQPESTRRSERDRAALSYEVLPEAPARAALSLTGEATSPAPLSSTIEAFEQALTRALAEQSQAGLEIGPLLDEVRNQVGDVAIETDYLGQSAGGQWLIAILWLPRPSDQGFALVTSGGLADSAAVKFFAVEYGRRIFSCLEPARVRRDGKDISVVHKGRVESS